MSNYKDSMNLAGRRAVITGASSGLGAHFAKVLAGEGAEVALIARRTERLQEQVAQITSEGGKAHAFAADLTHAEQTAEVMDKIACQCGGIDILVNNAGIARTRPLLEMSEMDWASVIETNLTAVWRCSQQVARLMAEQGEGGSIINIASILGHRVQAQQCNYAAAKAGVEHLTRAMARDLGQYGIRVNALSPGYFQTEINEDFFATEAGEKLVSRLFPRRLGHLNELSAPLLLLASDAGSFINGVVLPVDGGTTLAGL